MLDSVSERRYDTPYRNCPEVAMEYDVVIIGASISGCSAAIHLGRAGLRVALLEKHRSIETPKRLCGHFLLGGAQEPLERLGVWDELVEIGAGTGTLAVWSEHGWLNHDRAGSAPPFLNLRRSTLDPHLRRTAAGTPGVDLLLGHSVTGLLRRGDRAVGVTARRVDGDALHVQARLVVGADGHRSKAAELAGASEKTYPNSRAFLYAYYRDVPFRVEGDAAVWWHGDDWAVLTPTDGGLTEVALMPRRTSLPELGAQDLSQYVEDYFRRLPDGPDLRADQRASKVVASFDYPLVRRHATPAPGMALIGDAALTTDPAPAPGCTWALLSAQWLAEHTAAALLGGGSVDKALSGYRKAHRRLEREFFFMRSDAATGTANPIQRLLREAAVHDPVTSERLLQVGMQTAPTTTLLSPTVIARAWDRRRRGRHIQATRSRGAAPTAVG
jgi:2-polyprenyl-6-methoxyphenol hydroxylase-like FAD-dependent oxidoreductase